MLCFYKAYGNFGRGVLYRDFLSQGCYKETIYSLFGVKAGELDMSTEENKRIARRFYEEVVSTGNVSLLDELISPGYEEVMDGVRHPVGLEGARAHVVGVRQTYPDLRIAVDLDGGR